MDEKERKERSKDMADVSAAGVSDSAYGVSDSAYDAAKELAESYTDLLKQKESYKGKLGRFPHYTIDDVYYLLTQGAHEQTERVQSCGDSDPVCRAVANAQKTMKRLNNEMDAEYQKSVVDPYMEICEKVHLFEVCMNSLRSEEYHIADQLYIQKKPKKDIVNPNGARISRRQLEKEIQKILTCFADVLEGYDQFRKSKGCQLGADGSRVEDS